MANIDSRRFEQILQQFFADARMDMQLRDRFGGKVEPREWFLVPLPVVRNVIDLIISGDIENWMYQPDIAQLVPRNA